MFSTSLAGKDLPTHMGVLDPHRVVTLSDADKYL
jgi:hypothetical protein